MEPDQPEQWELLPAAMDFKTELDPSVRLNQTTVNIEQDMPPSPPQAPSRRSDSLRGSFMEKNTSLRPNRSEHQITSLLSGSSEQQPTKSEEPVGPVVKKFSITTNWCFAAICLLLICSILLSMVIIMGSQVSKLSEMAKEQTHQMHLEILVLTETLRQLQTGQDHTCSVCKIKWVQRADHCFLLSHKKMAWDSSRIFCAEELSSLAVADIQEEMVLGHGWLMGMMEDFMLRETNKYFDISYGQFKYHKFWIGLKYDTEIEKWIWTNGTPFALHPHPKLGQKGCAYLQNGKFHSQDCSQVACFICKAKVQFGWS